MGAAQQEFFLFSATVFSSQRRPRPSAAAGVGFRHHTAGDSLAEHFPGSQRARGRRGRLASAVLAGRACRAASESEDSR
jgi:hypothetical protein